MPHKPILQVEGLGDVLHVFSHIKQTYIVYRVELSKDHIENINFTKNNQNYQKVEWMNEKTLLTSAISTAMKKVFKLEQQYLTKVSTNKDLGIIEVL